jgi:DNA-binding NarL/FixJ family response regulator
MEQPLSILLVEDDQETCKRFSDYIETIDDIRLIGITNNSDKAISFIKDFLPEAVILDLELHRGGGNGLFVLQHLKNISFRPYVLVTTNNSSTTTLECARQLGADFIMQKHQQNYSEKEAVDFLYAMKNIIREQRRRENQNADPPESPDQRSKRIVRKITAELNRIGISPKLVGYRYLIDAIQIIMKEPTHNVCSIIGNTYHKTEASVERAMQNAINKAWKTSDINDLLLYYTAKISSDKGVPTVTEFIYYYVHKLMNDE